MTKVGQIVENVTRVGQKSLYPPQSPTLQTIPGTFIKLYYAQFNKNDLHATMVLIS